MRQRIGGRIADGQYGDIVLLEVSRRAELLQICAASMYYKHAQGETPAQCTASMHYKHARANIPPLISERL